MTGGTRVAGIIVALFSGACAQSQDSADQTRKRVGGLCEGCEAIYEYGARRLDAVDTLPAFGENEHTINLTGIVLQHDGISPAKDVIVYIYHTNRSGIYEKRGDEAGWGRRHGYIRGWVKTDSQGRYSFFTFRPAAYPGGTEAEHVHVIIKEPARNEYYIDDFLFDDDPLLTKTRRARQNDRGGSGIVRLRVENGILTGRRNIVLGKNIEDYD